MVKDEKNGNRVMLHRALSKLGFCSRKQGAREIKAGKVKVNGRVVTDPLAWVDISNDEISYDHWNNRSCWWGGC